MLGLGWYEGFDGVETGVKGLSEEGLELEETDEDCDDIEKVTDDPESVSNL